MRRSHTHLLQINCSVVGAVTTTVAGENANILCCILTLCQVKFNCQGDLGLSHTCKQLVLQEELLGHRFHLVQVRHWPNAVEGDTGGHVHSQGSQSVQLVDNVGVVLQFQPDII